MKTIVFYQNKSIFSKIAQWVTRSQTSHVALCIQFEDTQALFHGTLRGVVVDSRDIFETSGKNSVVAEYEVLPEFEEGFKNALQNLGRKYDLPGLFGVGVVILLWRWLRVRSKNFLASPSTLICSELIVRLNDFNEIRSFSQLDPERTSPGDLLRCCELNTFSEFRRKAIH